MFSDIIILTDDNSEGMGLCWNITHITIFHRGQYGFPGNRISLHMLLNPLCQEEEKKTIFMDLNTKSLHLL